MQRIKEEKKIVKDPFRYSFQTGLEIKNNVREVTLNDMKIKKTLAKFYWICKKAKKKFNMNLLCLNFLVEKNCELYEWKNENDFFS